MTYDEKTLIQHICNGDTKKFGLLVDRYGSSLLLFVGRIVEQQEDAEDVLQNTFIAAYEHLKEYNPQRASIFTWLQRIAYHETLYYLRRHKKRLFLPLEVNCDIPEELPDTIRTEQLDEAIQQLSPEEQMLLHLFYFDKRSLKDISYIMGGSTDTLSRDVSKLTSRLYRIRQRLKTLLTRMNND